MSSLAAAQADGYYYPREWRPEHGSLNQFHGSHPLGSRAKADGVLVVRFETPFDCICTSCSSHIGRGVRFNARKRRVGAYFSTPLYEFALKCPSCGGEMIVRTDPEARGYALEKGIRKKADAADALADADVTTERLNDPEVGRQIRDDPFFRLEHEGDDLRAARDRARGIELLVERQDAQFRDDYSSNASLRAAFRKDKAKRKRREQEADRLGLGIPLLDVHPDDVVAAKSVVFSNLPGRAKRSAKRVASSSRTDKKAASRTASDSFQHFGDPLGSKLHQMKQLAMERRRHQRETKPSSTSSSALSVRREAIAGSRSSSAHTSKRRRS